MNLNFCLLFFILVSSCCFTSALLCYKCGSRNAAHEFKYCLTPADCKQVMNFEPFKSNSGDVCNWQTIQCSGSCLYEWTEDTITFGHAFDHRPYTRRFVRRFVIPIYFWVLSSLYIYTRVTHVVADHGSEFSG